MKVLRGLQTLRRVRGEVADPLTLGGHRWDRCVDCSRGLGHLVQQELVLRGAVQLRGEGVSHGGEGVSHGGEGVSHGGG